MPLPFLLAVPFGACLDRVINELIAPAMLATRLIRQINTGYSWKDVDSAAFWKIVEDNGHMAAIRKAWQTTWDGFRPQRIACETDKGPQTALRITPQLKTLRGYFRSDDFVVPDIRSREIDLLASLIDPDYERAPLERVWTKLRQVYEQEMDRRVYQDQARTGALRDSLLACFAPFSNPTAEFLAMLCYWNFPYLSLSFLTAFTRNHGSNRATRQRRIPYLMWYLDLPQAEQALAADEARIAQAIARELAQTRTECEQVQAARDAELGKMGTVWRVEP
jgi:hypothetical protein